MTKEELFKSADELPVKGSDLLRLLVRIELLEIAVESLLREKNNDTVDLTYKPQLKHEEKFPYLQELLKEYKEKIAKEPIVKSSESKK